MYIYTSHSLAIHVCIEWTMDFIPQMDTQPSSSTSDRKRKRGDDTDDDYYYSENLWPRRLEQANVVQANKEGDWGGGVGGTACGNQWPATGLCSTL